MATEVDEIGGRCRDVTTEVDEIGRNVVMWPLKSMTLEEMS